MSVLVFHRFELSNEDAGQNGRKTSAKYHYVNKTLLLSFEEYHIPQSTAQGWMFQGNAPSPTTVAGRLGVDDGEPSHVGLGKPRSREGEEGHRDGHAIRHFCFTRTWSGIGTG